MTAVTTRPPSGELEPAATGGNAEAQALLGYMYMTGQGIRADDAEAAIHVAWRASPLALAARVEQAGNEE